MSCAACGSADRVIRLDLGDGFQLAECTRCGLVSTSPALPGSEIGRYYPESYYGEKNRRFHPVLESLIRVFRSRRCRAIEAFAPKGRIIDVGCGRGVLLGLMRDRGWETHGVEVSETAAHHAREILGLSVWVGEFADSPHPPASVDAVVIWHVLEHLLDPVAALAKAAEVIRPGGVLVVAVPNFESWQAGFSGRHWFHLDVPRHYHHFRTPVLRRLLEEHGFSVETVRHFSLEQNPYGWIQSLLNRLGFRFNLLYDILKNETARSEPHPIRAHPLQAALMFVALPAVAAVSGLLFLLEVAARRGGTVEFYARRPRSLPADAGKK
ncbi:MAG: class I SAM-dependent methyltransferase [Holophagales bacterium]|nr:class I SAM-dependent methyltransferase [Holophagales bacterium]